MGLPFETFGYAFLGGLLPALVWLYFLLKEEGRCPQPHWAVFVMFIAGMFAVPLVLPFEDMICHIFQSCTPSPNESVVIAWAAIEEITKYVFFAAGTFIFRSVIRNPVDIVVSMVTVALGFAAVENALFLIDPLSKGHFLSGFLLTNNLRFIGATLLHVVASSAVGFAVAFSTMIQRAAHTAAASFGLILAIGLHAVFNFFILQEDGSHTILAFFTVWTGALALLATFEILKFFRDKTEVANTC